jgi:hypothetical protein
MRVSVNHAIVPAVLVAESRSGVVPVWSGAVVWTDTTGRMGQDAQRASEEARCARRREGEPAVSACFGQEGSRQSGTLPKRKTGKVAEEQSDWLANRRPSLSL